MRASAVPFRDNVSFRTGISQGSKKKKKDSSHAHKTGSCYLLGVLFKISDEHPRPFYMGAPPRGGYYLQLVQFELSKYILILYQCKPTSLKLTVKGPIKVFLPTID